VVCFLVSLGAIRFGPYLSDGVLAAFFTGVGIMTGFIAYARVCAKQEPAMRAHIDRECIKRRLAEPGNRFFVQSRV
jgi:hypothetical protein